MSRIRALVTSASLAILVLATAAAPAFAAGGRAEPGRYTFGDDYCFVSGATSYCFEQDGQLHFVQVPEGREMAVINYRQTTKIYQSGVLVGESVEISVDKSVWEDGGLGTMTAVSHTRASFGDVTCVVTSVLRIQDYEVTVDHWNAPDCS
jgi:hypothetical protein